MMNIGFVYEPFASFRLVKGFFFAKNTINLGGANESWIRKRLF